MKKLWAPWRSRYIRHLDRKKTKCLFCVKPKQKKDKKNYILKRGRYCYAILNRFPYNNGHVMIVPYKHLADFSQLTKDQIWEMIQWVSEFQKKLTQTIKPVGFNIGVNIGKDAGAGFQHLHIHLLPRWRGDTNFMPILANTKVVSASLAEVYRLLTKQ